MEISKENQIWLKWLTKKKLNHPILLIEVRSGTVVVKLVLVNRGDLKTITAKSKDSINDCITEVKSKFAFYNLENAIWVMRPEHEA